MSSSMLPLAALAAAGIYLYVKAQDKLPCTVDVHLPAERRRALKILLEDPNVPQEQAFMAATQLGLDGYPMAAECLANHARLNLQPSVVPPAGLPAVPPTGPPAAVPPIPQVPPTEPPPWWASLPIPGTPSVPPASSPGQDIPPGGDEPAHGTPCAALNMEPTVPLVPELAYWPMCKAKTSQGQSQAGEIPYGTPCSQIGMVANMENLPAYWPNCTTP